MAGEWDQALLTDLIEFTRDGEWGSEGPGADDVEMLVVRGADFARLRLGALDEIPRRFIERRRAERKRLQVDDVLIETAGGTKDQSTGRTAIVKSRHIERAGLPLTCASFARFLRFKREKVDPHFMYWWLQSLHISGEMEVHQVQHTGVARFQFTKFSESMMAPVPTLSEQRAIAHILGTLDEKIELNRRMSATLEAMARALFKSWFVDFDPVRAKSEGRDPGLPKPLADLFPARLVDSDLGEIPEGWKLGTLGEISEKAQYGYTASAIDRPVGPKFLRITDINKRPWIEWASVPHCTITDTDSEQYRLSVGDILIARMADPGHGVMIEENIIAVFASYLIRFRLLEPSYGRYIQYWLRSDPYWRLVRARGSGTTRVSLNAKVLAGFHLVLPPAPLAAGYGSYADSLRTRVVANVSETHSLIVLRDTLLPKLISGELRVAEAERIIEGVSG
jgi:type I restriction enzyme S subunit